MWQCGATDSWNYVAYTYVTGQWSTYPLFFIIKHWPVTFSPECLYFSSRVLLETLRLHSLFKSTSICCCSYSSPQDISSVLWITDQCVDSVDVFPSNGHRLVLYQWVDGFVDNWSVRWFSWCLPQQWSSSGVVSVRWSSWCLLSDGSSPGVESVSWFSWYLPQHWFVVWCYIDEK